MPYRFRLVVKKSESKNVKILESFIGSREIDDPSTNSFPTVELLRKSYPHTRIVFSSNSITLHKQLVMAGQGVSIVPEVMIEAELKKNILVDIFPKKIFQWDLLVFKRKTDHLGAAAKAFLDLV